ncbi:hypothetical protein IKQ21_01810 [bacterium]|nr:hypothetical protein [bacterium]
MKKIFLTVISLMILSLTISSTYAKTTSNSSLASAIKLYKSGNYTQAYLAFQNIVSKDPSNAVACYYLAISSVQVGKKEEAIENYTKVIELSTNRQLTNYAKKGKICIEDAEKCSDSFDDGDTDIDKFVKSRFGTGFSNEARSEFEKQKIENLKREINRNGEISPSKFREYRDFSSELPTNDEIVSAMRVLQQAGLSDFSYNGMYSANNSDMQMLNMLTGGDTSKISPDVLQSLLTNRFTGGF